MTDEIREIIEGVDADDAQYVTVDRQVLAYEYIRDCIEEGVDENTTLADFLKAIEP